MLAKLFVAVAITAVVIVTAFAINREENSAGYRLSGPYTHKNLSLFVLLETDRVEVEELMTLDEAMSQGKITIHEKGEVQELDVENNSDVPIFIQAGCIVKGGRQDRVFRYDMVLKPNSGRQPIKAFCVEKSRWSQRGDENPMKFETDAGMFAHKNIKLAAMVEQSQGDVWKEVDGLKDKLVANARGGRDFEAKYGTSLPLAMSDTVVGSVTSEYVKTLIPKLEGINGAIGLVTVINGDINSADIYRSSELFEKMRAILIDAAALEAVAEFDLSIETNNTDVDDVLTWLIQSDKGMAELININDDMVLKNINTDKTYNFETYVDSLTGGWIHRSIISK